MARSTRLPIGMRSAPTTEMYTRCAAPARDAARTRFRALYSSPLALPAQCTMVPAPSSAGSIPSPVARSPVTNSMPSVASIGDLMVPPNMIALLQVSLLNRDGEHPQVSILIYLSHRDLLVTSARFHSSLLQ